MATSSRTAPAQNKRTEAKLQTRMKLVQACLELLAEGGYDKLTTGKISRRAGIAQPTFYVHFADLEDLLNELAETTMKKIVHKLETTRSQFQANGDLNDITRNAYDVSIDAVKANAVLLKLFVGELHRPNTRIGACSQRLLDTASSSLLSDLKRFGLLSKGENQQHQLLADTLVMMSLQAGLGLADGRYTDRDAITDQLVLQTTAMLKAARH